MSTNIQTQERLDFLDALRGLAVLLMLWFHTADGWLRPGLKQGAAWGWIRSAGGHAAPIFLLLAGLSLSLGWTPTARAGQTRRELARGLQLVLLGYVLRAQMWMLDAGGYRQLKCWLAVLPLFCGYFALWRALSAYGRSAPAANVFWTGIAGTATGLSLVAWNVPSRFLPLLRVDILQAIGASLACLALLRPVLCRARALGLGLGLCVALLTPWVRSWMPGPLPRPLAGYLASWEAPAGKLAPTLFPLFPWFAYACIGASIGLALALARRRGRATNAALALAGVGFALAFVNCEAFRPAQRLIASHPQLTQLVRVSYRVGVALALAAPAVVFSQFRSPLRRPLLALGRASLFVYWVHLELAFGALARPLAHRLDFRAWAAGLGALVVLMALLASLWLRIRVRLGPLVASRLRPGEEPRSRAATASSA